MKRTYMILLALCLGLAVLTGACSKKDSGAKDQPQSEKTAAKDAATPAAQEPSAPAYGAADMDELGNLLCKGMARKEVGTIIRLFHEKHADFILLRSKRVSAPGDITSEMRQQEIEQAKQDLAKKLEREGVEACTLRDQATRACGGPHIDAMKQADIEVDECGGIVVELVIKGEKDKEGFPVYRSGDAWYLADL